MNNTNRIAVVTGASSGIGAGIARTLAAQGADLALVARRADRLEALRAELTDRPGAGRVLVLAHDLIADGAAEQVRRRVTDELGTTDLLVNAAGVLIPDLVGVQAMSQQLDLNLGALVRITQAFVPDLIESAQRRGCADLVNISSISAGRVEPGVGVYAASKAAVSHLSRNLRAELATSRVRVTNVEPGVVTTELLAGSEAGQAWLADVCTRIDPLSAAELAEVVAFAISRPAHVSLPELVVMPARQV
ncbi:SDR family oxidoreductase [Nocardia halotolerans]|uniref:SDR family oxidoreductase n=1 Tax=Nocardia halotolerans TaxID=1755878 RepID=A0ABV8VFF3_9NOCA